MVLPNLLIVGSQKCGTTWLHECLSKSKSIFGSRPKELNYFNTADYKSRQTEYENHFASGSSAKWRMESTPHYYQRPSKNRDIAKRIYGVLGGDVRLLVMLRDPVDRYLSCYTHHMIKGRTPYVEEIDKFTDEFGLLSLGQYATITKHWSSIFENIGIFFYDDLQKQRDLLVDRVMQFLETENDISSEQADFLTNAKIITSKKMDVSRDWRSMPKMTDDLIERLAKYYRDEVEELQEITGRDLSSWKSMMKGG